MTVRVTQQLNRTALTALLSSPSGAVAKDLHRRGLRVQNRAKLNLERDPRRIDTGRLRSSIEVQLITVGGVLAVRIGSNLFYALYVHDGTGLYGPLHHRIYPRHARVLRFIPKGGTRHVYARSVAGMKPNPYLRDALVAARTPG